MIVCDVNEEGRREILTIEPITEESEASYAKVFRKLEERGTNTSKFVISDVHTRYEKTFFTNILERLNREIRRKTKKVIGIFHNEESIHVTGHGAPD